MTYQNVTNNLFGLTQSSGCEYVRPEVLCKLSEWMEIHDCLLGEKAIKEKEDFYLPRPNAADKSEANKARYQAYLKRASFYNATAQTFAGLMGQVFTKDPLIELPKKLDILIENVDGSAINLVQLAKVAVGNVLPYGRTGILTDFSSSKGNTTVAEISTARPTLRCYNPWDIINWRYGADDNNKRKLTLVVLREEYIYEDDGFQHKTKYQYKVLRLEDKSLVEADGFDPNSIDNNQIYTMQIYQDRKPATKTVPLDFSGKPFKEILFTFIGAEDNTADVDKPPLGDLASINIAHYHNSADLEEAAYMLGQPTIVFSGLDEEWIDDVFKDTAYLGSRSGIPLPKDAKCELLEMSPNTILKDMMEHKERQMVAFGAKLVEQRSVQRTATEAGLEASAESSTLVSVAKNAAHAIVQNCKWACAFVGETALATIKFEINTDFAISRLSAVDQKQVIDNWTKGAICWEEMRLSLRKGNIPLIDDTKAKAQVDSENTARASLAIASKPVNNNSNNFGN